MIRIFQKEEEVNKEANLVVNDITLPVDVDTGELLQPASENPVIENNEVTYINKNHYRDFISIKDICAAINILYNNKSYGIYNIGSGKKILISETQPMLKIHKKFSGEA